MNTLPVPNPDPGFVMAAPMEQAATSTGSFQPQRLLGFVRRYWWIPLLTLVLALGSVTGLILRLPPTYLSEARMWQTVKMHLPEGSFFSEDQQDFVGTQTELLQSTTLREMTLARLRNSTNRLAVPTGQDGLPLPVTIRVRQSSKSAVFVLEASSANATFTQAYLNALMGVYLEYKKNVRQVVSGDTLASINEQMQRYARDMREQQDALLAFQRTNNLALLQEESTIAGNYLARLKTQLSDLQLQQHLLTNLVSTWNQGGTGTTNADLAIVTALAGSPGEASPNSPSAEQAGAFRELEVLRIQRDRLSRHLRPQHPKLVRLASQIDRQQKLLEVFRRQTRDRLQASRQAIQIKIANIQTSIAKWEKIVVQANSVIARADQLKLDVQRTQQVYDRLALLVQNVGISRNIDQETLQVLDPASEAKRSYAQVNRLAAAGGVGGLGLGLAVIFLIAFLDDRFLSVREVNDKLGDQVVGQVPEVHPVRGALPVLHESDRQALNYAESYRSLRSALLFLAVEGIRPKVILVTSAIPNEGKSTVAVNLARTLAQGGARVLLVDGDLRKGVLHQLLNLTGEPGLPELLQNPTEWERSLQMNSVANLHFLPCGKATENPGDLFLSPALDQLLHSWRERFDHVVIDGTPVFAADDASTLAPKVDGTLFVVRSRYSGARQVQEALEQLYQRQARILGIVFNRADHSARSYYYYKYDRYAQTTVTR